MTAGSADERDYEGVGRMSKLERVCYSIGNLFESFGRIHSALAGTMVSLALALPGLVAWFEYDGWIAIVGIMWAILNLLGPVKWVIEG